MADRGSARRGSYNSLICGCDCLPSRAIGNTTSRDNIGNPILDNSTVSAFRRWRFKPGTPRRVRIPITFVLTGAQY
jgi:TonB family protein